MFKPSVARAAAPDWRLALLVILQISTARLH